jgi:two-component system, OmpR family, phosphate regulon sensor histidine kinase PhoR
LKRSATPADPPHAGSAANGTRRERRQPAILDSLRSRFFWELCLSYAVLVLVTAAAIGLLAHATMQRSLRDTIREGLRDEAAFFATGAYELLRQGAVAPAQAEVRRIGGETGSRVTLILPDGRVLADSGEDPAVMESHAGRPEVRQALRTGEGTSRRFSGTVGEDMLYLARAVRGPGDEIVGVLRVAVPLAHVRAILGRQRMTIVAGAVAGMLVGLFIGLLVLTRITGPIREMIRVAEDLGAGRYERRVRRIPRSEIGVLGTTLNRLADELAGRIATLSRERAHVQAMVAGMREGVVAVDSEDRVVFTNPAARRWLRLEAPDLVSGGEPSGRRKAAPRVWEQVRHGPFLEMLAEARRRGSPARSEIVLQRDGADRLLEAQATRFSGGGQEGLVVVLHDVTEVRRLEQVRRDFVANVSHELKTPLTSMRGFVDTLLSGALHDEEVNEKFLGKIGEQVERLDRLVEDLLELARIEAHRGIGRSQDVAWRPVVETALRQVEPAFGGQGLRIEVEEAGEPVVVRGDPDAMLQVLVNLLDNARKYTDPPGLVRIRIGREEGAGVLEVEDSGVGIAKSHLPLVFERFYRVDPARSKERGGTGLGLSIVKHLVEAMGGTVDVESRVGRGSRFIVRLPPAP